MDIVDPVLVELLTLCCGPFDTQLTGIFISLALHDLPGQWLGNIAVEGLWHHSQLRQLGKRLDAWNDGDRDAHRTGFLHKLEILLVVVEQLGHGILCAQILFLLQILHVHLQVRSLFMLFGVAGHAEVELLAWTLDRRAVSKKTIIKLPHLFD